MWFGGPFFYNYDKDPPHNNINIRNYFGPYINGIRIGGLGLGLMVQDFGSWSLGSGGLGLTRLGFRV